MKEQPDGENMEEIGKIGEMRVRWRKPGGKFRVTCSKLEYLQKILKVWGNQGNKLAEYWKSLGENNRKVGRQFPKNATKKYKRKHQSDNEFKKS